MSEQFTKGPWEYDCWSSDVSAGGLIICDTCSDGSQESEVNAALIACAPEMYVEIKQDIDWLKRMRNSFVIGSDGFRACSLHIESKQKLLAKARGES